MQLTLTDGLGPILTRRLIDAAGSAEAACASSAALLRSIEGIGSAKSSQIHNSIRKSADEAQRELDRAEKIGVSIICPDDEIYPTLLRDIPDPPGVLYVKGSLEPRDLNSLAIVGSRRCSFYGREQAERFAALLAGAGLTVVSGGARGIDSAAHRGAMSHLQGRTIAVLGCGIDQVYPPENASLFEQIAQRGAVMSEFAIGTPPIAENFPRRNRIVSGMSRGVVVIEADERSGALITARQACDDHGRPVFALPG
ncbi:MAG TPA: DNA-processing protein DprA, partial [Tepidisphaeraceae bacterium]